MSDTFTASNGSKVRWVGGELGIGDPPLAPLTDKGVVALREFFQHERDKELGRWRWPENPNYLVYPHEDGDFALVVSEVSGDSAGIYLEADRHTGSNFERAAVAYFAAHPEPKPWHDAKPGEVWALKYEGVEQAWGVGFDGLPGSQFVFACGDSRISASDVEITAGRRIWPEVKP